MEEDFSPERTVKVGSKNWRPLSQEIKKPQKFRGLVNEENVIYSSYFSLMYSSHASCFLPLTKNQPTLRSNHLSILFNIFFIKREFQLFYMQSFQLRNLTLQSVDKGDL